MSIGDMLSADDRRMARYDAERAACYERVHHKPERQVDPRRMESEIAAHFGGLRVLEIACGAGWLRTLDDGSTYEVAKNFPTPDEAIAALGPRARDPRWVAYEHYWALAYDLA